MDRHFQVTLQFSLQPERPGHKRATAIHHFHLRVLTALFSAATLNYRLLIESLKLLEQKKGPETRTSLERGKVVLLLIPGQIVVVLFGIS